MGEDESQAGSQLDGSGPRDPEQIRADIERTRQELGDTVAAVAQKADVKAQAQAKVDEAKQSVLDKRDELKGRAQAAMPDSGGEAVEAARAKRVPLMVAGAFGAGVVIGRLTGG